MQLTKEVKEACVYAMAQEKVYLSNRPAPLWVMADLDKVKIETLRNVFRQNSRPNYAVLDMYKSIVGDAKEALFQHDKAMLSNENVTPDSLRYYNSYKHKYGLMERLILDKALKKNPVYELLLLEAPDLIGTIN